MSTYYAPLPLFNAYEVDFVAALLQYGELQVSDYKRASLFRQFRDVVKDIAGKRLILVLFRQI